MPEYPKVLSDRITAQKSTMAGEGYSIERQHKINDAMRMLEDPRVEQAMVEILAELARAEKLHPVWPEGTLRQVAIMAGEAGEAMRAGLHYAEGRGGMDEVTSEAIQTGAMAVRLLINLEG